MLGGVVKKKPLVLSDAVIKLQQELSEKFGIPTFTQTGDISTVPTTKPIGDINVGVGKFGGETIKSFTETLNQGIINLKQTGGSIGSTVFKKPLVKNIDPNQTNANEPKDSISGFDFGQTFNEGIGSVGELVAKNPTILIVGLGLLALTVLKR